MSLLLSPLPYTLRRRVEDVSPLTGDSETRTFRTATTGASTIDTEETEGSRRKKRRQNKNLSSSERDAVLHYCLKNLDPKKKPREVPLKGTYTQAARTFGCDRHTVSAIWNRYQKTITVDLPGGNIKSKIKGTSGRKHSHTQEELTNLIKRVRRVNRGTLRDLSEAIDVPYTTLRRYFKQGMIKKFNIRIKPILYESHKIHRCNHCLSYIDANTGNFDPMYNTVHVDEKWFFMKRKNSRVYLTPDEYDDEEKEDFQTRGNKRWIQKIMFLCAVARPRWDYQRNCWFDGKIGIWPIIQEGQAQRDSKNRPAGSTIIRPMNIDAAVYTDMMIDKVLPAIMEKWPTRDKNKTIWINEDNSKCHPDRTRVMVQDVAAVQGWDIRGRPQPANSPDMNILDLGFFHSIQTLQYKTKPETMEELIQAVQVAFHNTKHETLDKTFMSLQRVMMETMRVGGDNTYKLPHQGKDAKKNKPSLDYVVCPLEAIETAQRVIGGPCLYVPAPIHPLLQEGADTDDDSEDNDEVNRIVKFDV